MKRTASPEADSTVLSVSAFTAHVRHLLEEALPEVWVKGEISNLRQQASGHAYFTLKDAGAQVSCVLFRGDALRQVVPLREGMEVCVFGGVSVFEPRGVYQLVVRWVVEDGQGKLRQAFDRLKEKLAAEGLFDPARKKAIPDLPRTVGFITSPTGAVVRDFVGILRRRGWRGRLVVLPARVQGTGAAQELCAMLEVAARMELFDLLVIGRGGGSLEDLWAFNEEPLVRAVAACPVPIISAVGHEIDFTLCDFAADWRAETPSAAAGRLADAWEDAESRVGVLSRQVERLVDWRLERLRTQAERVGRDWRAVAPESLLERCHLRVDDGEARLEALFAGRVEARRQALHGQELTLAGVVPEVRLRAARSRLESCGARLERALALTLAAHQARCEGWARRLEGLSLEATLRRGFVCVTDAEGGVLSRTEEAAGLETLRLHFSDGELRVWTQEQDGSFS